MQMFEKATALADKLSPSEKIQLLKHLALSLRDDMFDEKEPQSIDSLSKTDLPEGFEVEDSRAILLNQSAALADDENADEFLDNIYRQR